MIARGSHLRLVIRGLARMAPPGSAAQRDGSCSQLKGLGADSAIHDPSGCIHDLRRTPPGKLLGVVAQAVCEWRWQRVCESLPLSGPPAWRPIISCLRQLSARPLLAAALRSAIAGRQWPQQRLRQASLADDPWCRKCILTGPDNPPSPSVGTLFHRLWKCPGVAQMVSCTPHPTLQVRAIVSSRSGDPSENCY